MIAAGATAPYLIANNLNGSCSKRYESAGGERRAFQVEGKSLIAVGRNRKKDGKRRLRADRHTCCCCDTDFADGSPLGTVYYRGNSSRVVTKNEGEEKKERQQSASVGGQERVEPRGLLD